jgi:hypothetical protein
MDVKFIDNPSAPGAKMEMERLRSENARLKRQLEGGPAGSSLTDEEALTEQQMAEQPRSFMSGNCTITIIPLSQLPPMRMNPDFGGIVMRGQEEIAQSRMGQKKTKQERAQVATVKAGKKVETQAQTQAEDEEDDASLRFQLIELK